MTPIIRERSMMRQRSTPIVRLACIGAAIFVSCIVLAAPAVAQNEPLPSPMNTDTAAGQAPERSPGGAFIRSLVLPGWGQAWVGAPIRGGIYFAIESAAAWMVFKTASQLEDARAEQEFLREIEVLEPDQKTSLVTAREAQLEDWVTFAVFMLFFSGADAYVAGYLADFSEHVGVVPEANGTMNIQATIPVGGR